MIPLVIRHNGEVYKQSMELIESVLPEITEEYLCQISLFATVVFEKRAEEFNTKTMKKGLMNGDLAKIFP